ALVPPVDCHAEERVNERYAIRPAVGRGLCDRDDIGDVRGQLGDERERARVLTAADNASCHRRIGGEVDPSTHVRAGEIQLDAGQAAILDDLRGQLDELVLGLSGDVADYCRRQVAQIWEVVFEEVVDSVVVEADGVEQAGRRFDGPRGRVADAGPGGDRLGDNAPQPREIDEPGHLAGVAKSPRRYENWIAQ